MRRRRILICFGVVMVLVVLYEISFRVVTASCGEVDMEAHSPRVYYSDDLMASFAWRQVLFGFRTKLPFGKVRLSKGSGAYVDGGRFYQRLPDGTWRDLTET